MRRRGFGDVGYDISASMQDHAQHPERALKLAGVMLFLGGIAGAALNGEIVEGGIISGVGAGLYKVAEPVGHFLRPDLDNRGDV